MGLNANHTVEELGNIRCAIVEKNISQARVNFLTPLLTGNGYKVVCVEAEAPKAKASTASTASTSSATAATDATDANGATDATTPVTPVTEPVEVVTPVTELVEVVTMPTATPITMPEATPVTEPAVTPGTKPESTPITMPAATPVTEPEATAVTELVEVVEVGEVAAEVLYTLGVTDLLFNPINAIFGRLLRTIDGHVVTNDYWNQTDEVSRDEIPYFERK
jgi:hypothetical protein